MPFVGSDASIIDLYDADGASGPKRNLKEIVDSMVNPPPSASLGRFPTSRPMRQAKPKLADVDNPSEAGEVGRFLRCEGRQLRQSWPPK